MVNDNCGLPSKNLSVVERIIHKLDINARHSWCLLLHSNVPRGISICYYKDEMLILNESGLISYSTQLCSHCAISVLRFIIVFRLLRCGRAWLQPFIKIGVTKPIFDSKLSSPLPLSWFSSFYRIGSRSSPRHPKAWSYVNCSITSAAFCWAVIFIQFFA